MGAKVSRVRTCLNPKLPADSEDRYVKGAKGSAVRSQRDRPELRSASETVLQGNDGLRQVVSGQNNVGRSMSSASSASSNGSGRYGKYHEKKPRNLQIRVYK
eukprot:999242-Rhodomonas_salina.2